MIYRFSFFFLHFPSAKLIVSSMVKAKNDEGSSTDSCDDKEKLDDKDPGCSHLAKSLDSSKLRKVIKNGGIHQKCCECEKMPDGMPASTDEMFEYDNTLWLCLRCGSQLCGRRMNQHALAHYNVSSFAPFVHCFSTTSTLFLDTAQRFPRFSYQHGNTSSLVLLV